MNAVNDSEIEDITKEQTANEINNNLITKQNDKYLSKIELFAQGFMLLIAGFESTTNPNSIPNLFYTDMTQQLQFYNLQPICLQCIPKFKKN